VRDKAIIDTLDMIESDKLGYGDINTCYTAFREFMEESSSPTHYVFNLDLVYAKLFITKQYIFLGGDASYGYDTYVMFFTIDNFSDADALSILHKVARVDNRNNRNLYKKDISGPNANIGLENLGNSEMSRIDIVSLIEVLSPMISVNYKRYAFCSPINANKNRGKKRKPSSEDKLYHTVRYQAPFYDRMRPTFADAMVRYNAVLIKVCNTFEKIKGALI
jgi:hypothetical protein